MNNRHGAMILWIAFLMMLLSASTFSPSSADTLANAYLYADVTAFGAKGDGVNDDTAAIQAALNSGKPVIVPPGKYRTSDTLHVHNNTSLSGVSSATTIIIAGADVSPVIMLSDGNHRAAELRGVTVTRDADMPSTSVIGVEVFGAERAQISDVISLRHGIGLLIVNGPAVDSFETWVDHFRTGGITDAHVVIDTSAEIRFTDCRFGMNGRFDFNSNAYIRVQGGNPSHPAAGPNTGAWVNCQFNQGNSAYAKYWVEFVNRRSPKGTTCWQFSNCHIEAVSNGIYTDETWDTLERLIIDNLTGYFNVPSPGVFFDLNPNTTLLFGHIVGSFIACKDLNLTSAGERGSFSIVSTDFTNNVTLKGRWAKLSFIGNHYLGRLNDSTSGKTEISN